jgi:hypothetical protein
MLILVLLELTETVIFNVCCCEVFSAIFYICSAVALVDVLHPSCHQHVFKGYVQGAGGLNHYPLCALGLKSFLYRDKLN